MLVEASVCPWAACSAAISACEKGSQWAAALWLLGGMRSVAVQRNTASFNAAVSACEKERQWRRALLLLGEMRRGAVECSTVTFNAASSACEKGGS